MPGRGGAWASRPDPYGPGGRRGIRPAEVPTGQRGRDDSITNAYWWLVGIIVTYFKLLQSKSVVGRCRELGWGRISSVQGSLLGAVLIHMVSSIGSTIVHSSE